MSVWWRDRKRKRGGEGWERGRGKEKGEEGEGEKRESGGGEGGGGRCLNLLYRVSIATKSITHKDKNLWLRCGRLLEQDPLQQPAQYQQVIFTSDAPVQIQTYSK